MIILSLADLYKISWLCILRGAYMITFTILRILDCHIHTENPKEDYLFRHLVAAADHKIEIPANY